MSLDSYLIDRERTLIEALRKAQSNRVEAEKTASSIAAALNEVRIAIKQIEGASEADLADRKG